MRSCLLWPMLPVPDIRFFCPLYHEAEVMPQFVQSMLALDYPHEIPILFLTEDDDTETRNAIRKLALPAVLR